LNKIGSAEADAPQQIFLGSVVQSVVLIAASLIGGRLSDRTGRRKIFVLAAAIVYGVAMFAVAISSNFNGFLVGMAISGLGFGVYMAVDLALVADVLPDADDTAKDLGVLNIAGALPFSVAPAMAPAILAMGNGSYGVLYAAAGLCAVIGAVSILPVRSVHCSRLLAYPARKSALIARKTVNTPSFCRSMICSSPGPAISRSSARSSRRFWQRNSRRLQDLRPAPLSHFRALAHSNVS